jgi:hypothetical protein
VALAVGVYLNALDNPFVYDDFFTVTSNPSITSSADARWTVQFMPFRPVVNVSYAIDRAIWGYRPFGYHLTSIALHAAVCLLLFLFLRRALTDAGATSEGSPDATPGVQRTWAAFAGAALFAVHPMQSETVGYVSSRSEILCALFILAALLLARMAMGASASAPASSGAARRALAAGAACVCALLALLSKEVAASLPLLLFAYDRLLAPGDTGAKRRRVARVFIPLALLMVAAVAYRVRSLAGTDAALSAAPLHNLLTQAIVIWRYLGLLVVPAGQAIMHETRTVTSLTDPLALLAIAGLAALGAAAFRARRMAPLWALGMVWWFACIAPSSSVIALRQGMAEHRVYVASAGLAIVMSAVAAQVIRRTVAPSGRVPAAWTAVLIGTLAVCGALTVRRNTVWASPVSLWREAHRLAPANGEVRRALGDALRDSGDCSAAMIEYEAVLREQPRNREVMTNLGICLGSSGRLREAEQAFRRALEVDPTWVRSYTNLGALALIEGKPEQARDYYLRAIGLDSRNVRARMQLARIYEGVLRDYAGAGRLCAEALSIDPSTPGAEDCLARNNQLAGAARDGSK